MSLDSIERSGYEKDVIGPLGIPSLPVMEKKSMVQLKSTRSGSSREYCASDPADNDAWKDKGTGQLAIKCKEGVNKSTRESKPTILVRNMFLLTVGKVLLNALLYHGIKTKMQKNSIVATFHTAGISSNKFDLLVECSTFTTECSSDEPDVVEVPQLEQGQSEIGTSAVARMAENKEASPESTGAENFAQDLGSLSTADTE
ncbi:uncharacterized protein LOC114316446 [Camellia sinensis]|uniref:uncharacterized protein LOC114316446 n=1 Tax=Camellia sinensis TaxID=4442 RepID=UPI0010357350|nr:uncharacterized protein LOC114316446 [Camellia sinensis]